MNQKRNLVLAVCGLIVLTFGLTCYSVYIRSTTTPTIVKDSTSSVGINKYPKFVNPPNASIAFNINLDDLVKLSTIIFIGEVQKPYEDEHRKLEIKPGSIDEKYDKLFKLKGDYSYTDIKLITTKVKILEILKGDNKTQEITLQQNISHKGHTPDFQKGDKAVFFLDAIGIEDRHNVLHPSASIFYLDDGRIYPSAQLETLTPFTGMKLDEFENKIKRLLNE